ncbi:RICIN domain-containing protein [Streptomyces sp. NPDC004008]
MFSLLNSTLAAPLTVIARERLEIAMTEPRFSVVRHSADAREVLRLFILLAGLDQQWRPVQESAGRYHFVARHSGQCLSAAATPDNGIQLTRRGCDGSGAQTFQRTTR